MRLVLLFSFPICHSCRHLKHHKVNMDFLDILLAARMADSGARSARHSSGLVWTKLWNMSSLSAASSLYLSACEAARCWGRGATTALYPCLSFSFPSLLSRYTICCGNKMARHVISLSSCFLGAYRGKGGHCLWARKATGVLSSLSLPPLHLRDLGGESFPCLCVRGALSTLCKHTLPLRLGCPSHRDLCWLWTSYIISSASWLGACHRTKINPRVSLLL